MRAIEIPKRTLIVWGVALSLLVLTAVGGSYVYANYLDKPDPAVAEKLVQADASTDLYRHPEQYAEVMTPKLANKVGQMARQVVPQMDAIQFQSRLVSLDGTEMTKLGRERYEVRVSATVELQGTVLEKQTRSGVAVTQMVKVDGRWLADDYVSFGNQ